MTQQQVVDVMGQGLFTILIASAPPLLMGLTVGLIVSIFQTVTSIQEQTLAFVPKIIAVFVSLVIFGPFILNSVVGYFQDLLRNLYIYVIPPG